MLLEYQLVENDNFFDSMQRFGKTKVAKEEFYGAKKNCGLEDDVECKSFAIVSIDSLLVYEYKYYLQVYLDNCAYKIVHKQMIDYFDDNLFETDEDYFFDFDRWVLQMLDYDTNDLSKEINPTKSNNSKDCIACHYWFFNYGFKFQDSVCNGCHDLVMLCLSISDIAIITIEGVDYHCSTHWQI